MLKQFLESTVSKIKENYNHIAYMLEPLELRSVILERFEIDFAE